MVQKPISALLGLIMTVALLLLVACGGGKAKTEVAGQNIRIVASLNTPEIYIPIGEVSLKQKDKEVATISMRVYNTSQQEVQADVWLEALPGIVFLQGLKQEVSDNGARVARSGISMLPSENRSLEFSCRAGDEADPGDYSIVVSAKTSNGELIVTGLSLEIKPKRSP
jgi:uncharacterized membrane protein